MQAEDEKPTRLAAAKKKALELIDAMHSGDVGMVVSFADTARVEQMFTDNRGQLRRSIEAIQPTARRTSLAEALKVAAGLANPSHANQLAKDMPATMVILSDGNFDQPAQFALGNLAPVYLPIGKSQAKNVAIVAFSVRRHETKAGQWQPFARLANFGSEETTVSVELRLDGQLINAGKVTVSARSGSSVSHAGVAAGANGAAEVSPGGHAGQSAESAGVEESPGRQAIVFDPVDADAGVLSLKIATTDDLALDNEAWAVINPPRRAKVLLVTPGNEPLEIALGTSTARQLAELTVESPGFLDKESYQQQAAVGGYDLVIYDRCQPKTMPQANTLFLGAMPPLRSWKARPKVQQPQIIDVDPTHPLTRWLSLGDVLVAEATPLAPPPGGTVLIDSHLGPLFAVAPREAFEDAVLGFVLVDEAVGPDGQRRPFIGSNWPIRPSFPVFTLNILQYLGGGQTLFQGDSVLPGQVVNLESPFADKPIQVRSPSGHAVELTRAKQGRFSFAETDELGVYEVRCGGKTFQRFAVNLFSIAESDLRPRGELNIGHQEVAAHPSGGRIGRRETWKWLLLAGLGVLCLEWYIFHRRVQI